MRSTRPALLLIFCLAPCLGAASEQHGRFKPLDRAGTEFYFESSSGELHPVQAANEHLLSSVRTLSAREATVSLPASAFPGDGSVRITRAPSLDRGHEELRGTLLELDGGSFLLGGERVRFEAGKSVNGYEFDEISRNHFVGKDVVARGYRDGGVFKIASIVEGGELFNAGLALDIVGSDHAERVHGGFYSGRTRYILEALPSHRLSSSTASFRGTIFHDANRPVRTGDAVMILTMSGHQGDERGALHGHVAVGLGRVREDRGIDAEIYNVYIPPLNNKEIVSGNQRWVDYFGHVVGGQNNYRPTYTLLIYGVDPGRLLRVRERLEPYHSYFRVTRGQMSVDINCTTLSVQALALEGIYGNVRNGQNGSRRFPLLSDEYSDPRRMLIPAQIAYAKRTPVAEYLPRNMWDSVLRNLEYLNAHEALGAHRADFVFYAQTPSRRPRGGIAANELKDDLRGFLLPSGLRRID